MEYISFAGPACNDEKISKRFYHHATIPKQEMILALWFENNHTHFIDILKSGYETVDFPHISHKQNLQNLTTIFSHRSLVTQSRYAGVY